MASKKHAGRDEDSKTHGARKKEPEAAGFRPLESGIKAVILAQKKAAQAKAEVAAASAEKNQKPSTDKKRLAPVSPAELKQPKVRAKTLTAAEQRELDQMAKAKGRESEIFQAYMAGVTPLVENKKGRVTETADIVKKPVKPVTPAIDQADDQVRDHLMNLVEGATRFEVEDDGLRLFGRRLDLPPATLRRLRRGEMPIDARLDLHGKTAEDAKVELETFLRERRNKRDRVVLVIHGRGRNSPAGIGVLRGEIGAWLSQGRSSAQVAAFASAVNEDGGEGALYILLKP